jgi:hypothetical protein
MSFKRFNNGNWVDYAKRPDTLTVDFHFGSGDGTPYWVRMEQNRQTALQALKDAQATGRKYVLFTHGLSTSR